MGTDLDSPAGGSDVCLASSQTTYIPTASQEISALQCGNYWSAHVWRQPACVNLSPSLRRRPQVTLCLNGLWCVCADSTGKETDTKVLEKLPVLPSY